ncbi:response regulator transcription factor [Rubrivivax sp. A210]|uniref:response regulator transcription factor n=1 Tax=Rubrivivax sp. A210 TaxID=2772301 RepID=UPI001918B7FA|nr:response regulator [Rubrivivax sp. A210]
MPALATYIVEDSPVIRESLIATLEELAPVRVVGWAADEAAALLWLGQPGDAGQPAALVIVDLFLQGGSGLGVLRAAARLPRPAHLVVLSNYATPDMRRRCLELGAERVFDKSGAIDDLLAYCSELAATQAAAIG